MPEPASAVRLLEQPDWHVVDECESVRTVSADGEILEPEFPPPSRPGRGEVVALPRAGYRWGSPSASAHLPAVRFERAVIALAARSEALAAHVTRIEQRVDDLADQLFDAATQSDLIEIESRRARLAAEVARLAVELHGELDRRLGELARLAAASNAASGTVDRLGPLDRADAMRVELHLEHIAQLDTLTEDLRSA